MKSIASQRIISQFLRPRRPAGLLACHIFQTDAIDRTHRYAQLAAGAVRIDHGVHHLVAAQYGVGRANWQAQRAANAPVLVNHSDAARRFQTIGGIQRQDGVARDGGQPGNAFSAARWALVDFCQAMGNRFGVGHAVGVAAACALGLRQCRVDTAGMWVGSGWVTPALSLLLKALVTCYEPP